MTIHVSLPEELENLVHAHVDSGMYKSASEVVREALRDFFAVKSVFSPEQSQWIRQEISSRLEAVQQGSVDLVDGETFLNELSQGLA